MTTATQACGAVRTTPTEESRSMRTRFIAYLLPVVLAACAGDAGQSSETQDVSQFTGKTKAGSSSIDVQPGTPPVVATNVDPCTFFSKAELEMAFNVPFGPPKKGRNEPSCSFYNSNTGSVTVRAGERVSQQDFDALREQIGPRPSA
jgi:hypothetical protein